jgi:ectoine hydroxylase-related dioxygenase (phytanoyl-CoA dioxygenase family)
MDSEGSHETTKGFLSKEDIELFHKQGYVIVRNAFQPDELSHLNNAVSSATERSAEMAKSSQEEMFYIDGSRIVCNRQEDNSLRIARINGCCGVEPSLLSIVRSEKMVISFFELLGTRELEHLIAQIHPKLPGDGVEYPRHQDIQFRKSFDPEWQDVLGNGSYAICIMPVDPMAPENGGLWIDENSYPPSQDLEESRVWIYAEPGDLLFMHPYLFHGSSANTSATSSRRTLLTGFCAFGANHKAYPGAQVNTHLRWTEAGNIEITKSAWSEEAIAGSGSGH